MHLGNGTVTPTCAVYGATVAGIGLMAGLRLARRVARPDPLAFAAACAFVFAAQAFNLPVWPGVSGHLIGAVLLAHFFGAAWGMFGISLVLTAQSLLFGDGGWLALGLNIFNMGVLPCLIVFPILRHRGVVLTAWASVVAAAGLCGLQVLTVVSSVHQGVDVMLTLMGVHALIGLLEAAITVSVIEVARRLSSVPKRIRMLAGASAPLAIAMAAACGASPWPDGLEHTLSLYSVEPAMTSLITQVENWQTSIAGDYTLTGMAVGTLLVALVCASACLISRRRISW